MGVHAAENQVPFETGALENMEPGSIVNDVTYLCVTLCLKFSCSKEESVSLSRPVISTGMSQNTKWL